MKALRRIAIAAAGAAAFVRPRGQFDAALNGTKAIKAPPYATLY